VDQQQEATDDTCQFLSDAVESSGSDARLQLIVHVGRSFSTFRLPGSGQVTVGRSSECTVQINHPSVSRTHAVLTLGEPPRIRDTGSANGTRVGGNRIAPEVDVPFAVGDAMALGAALILVQRVSPPMAPRRVQSHDYFEARVDEECARRARQGGAFTLVRVNLPEDTNPARVQEGLHGALRAHDVLAVYAPGQYEILLDGVSGAKAEEIVARARKELSANAVEISTGVASYPTDGATAGALFAYANDAVRGARDSVSERRAPVSMASAMDGLRELVARVADSALSVLILGETGVGKEILAKTVHRQSPRLAGAFLRLNCAALSESLFESEVFGHERGAFTGAVAQKRGLLETADGGTVFLDEVGELPPSMQAKLLRVIEEREVTRVGGLAPISLDVRFITATNRDLEAEVARGTFRQDLFFRLNGITLVIPPLRERVDEIEALAYSFIAAASRGRARSPSLSPETLAMLKAYSWPGNIRELRNVIDRAALLCGDGDIALRHLPIAKMSAPVTAVAVTRSSEAHVVSPSRAPTARPPWPANERTTDAWPALRDARGATGLREELETLERQRILDALDRCMWNQTKAAQMLGLTRGLLMARLDAYGIARPRKGRGASVE
jgi:two-component system response regulator AtoC